MITGHGQQYPIGHHLLTLADAVAIALNRCLTTQVLNVEPNH